jgi:hypothetical protein
LYKHNINDGIIRHLSEEYSNQELKNTITQQGITITQQGITITDISDTLVSMRTKSRVAALRIAIQDLNSSFGMLNYFKRINNTTLSRQLTAMNITRVHGAHFMLVDPKVEKALILSTYNPKISVFDAVPTLRYKVLLLKQFICSPSFPEDIENGLGKGLIAGLRTYLESELPDCELITHISEDEKNCVLESVGLFFEDVPEFFV